MHMSANFKRLLLTGVALTALSACSENFDLDLRDLAGSDVDTSQAAMNLPARPVPDNRGVISYPTYQVVVAQRGDTVRTVAARIGADANTIATYNGIDPDTELRRDELLALPSRVAEPTLATGAVVDGSIAAPQVDVTTLASNAIDRAAPAQTTTPQATTPTQAAPVAAPPTAPAIQKGNEPIRHRVQRGETVYSISRQYGVPVKNIAEWNGLGSDLTVREGQFLLIPRGEARPTNAAPLTAVETPGTGSATPTPPSAAEPLPEETIAPAAVAATAPKPETPDLSATTKPTGNANAPLAYPVQGSIIRGYSAGKNEGIDIGVAAGTAVKAAANGTVAAITKDTNGVPIMVIRHDNNLLTVYTNLDGLTVAKDSSVSKGQTIGRVRAGSPAFLHFEVRQGLQSVDPTSYLP